MRSKRVKDEPLLQDNYLQTFRDILIPRVYNGSARLVLAHPALHGAAKESHRLPADISVLSKRGPLLSGRRQRSSYLRTAAWPEAGFHASRFPLLICVLDGEMDLRLGITKPMTNEYSHLDADFGYQVWRLPDNSICLVPPGVPYDDGSRPHWERPHLERAKSRLQWIHLMPIGALLHSCRTEGVEHWKSTFACIRDSHVAMLGELLTEDLGMQSLRAQEIRQADLLALFWRIEQGIASRQYLALELHQAMEFEPRTQGITEPASFERSSVERACRYIHGHLHEPLSVEDIAAYVYGSPSWLNRQFQSELGTPIMQYVTQRRIEEAKLLLADTDLAVSEIGRMVGYPDPSYFSQVFTRWTETSPVKFRNQSKLIRNEKA